LTITGGGLTSSGTGVGVDGCGSSPTHNQKMQHKQVYEESIRYLSPPPKNHRFRLDTAVCFDGNIELKAAVAMATVSANA